MEKGHATLRKWFVFIMEMNLFTLSEGGGLSISRHGSAFSRFPDMYSRTHVGMCLQYWLKRELWHRSVFILNFCQIDRVFTTCHKWVVSSLSDDVLSNTLS